MENVEVMSLSREQVVAARTRAAETIDLIQRNTTQAPPGLVERAVRAMWDPRAINPAPPVRWVPSPVLGAISHFNPSLIGAPLAMPGSWRMETAGGRTFGREPGYVRMFATNTAQPVTWTWEHWAETPVASGGAVSIEGFNSSIGFQSGLLNDFPYNSLLMSHAARTQIADAVSDAFAMVMGQRQPNLRAPTFDRSLEAAIRDDVSNWRSRRGGDRDRTSPILTNFVTRWTWHAWQQLLNVAGPSGLVRQNYDSWFQPLTVVSNEVSAMILGDLLPERVHEVAQARKTIATYTSGIWPFDGQQVIVSRRPIEIRLDALRRAHHAHSPAAVWPDGWSFDAFEGIVVPAWNRSAQDRTIAAAQRRRLEQIKSMGSFDQAMAMVRRMGWPQFIRSLAHLDDLPGEFGLISYPGTGALGSVQITTLGQVVPDPGNPGGDLRLYSIQVGNAWIGTARLRVLVCTNGTPEPDGTRREYGIVVPADFEGDALAAAAWAYGLKRRQYAQLARRT